MKYRALLRIVFCMFLTACSSDSPSEEKLHYDLSVWVSEVTDNAALVDDMVILEEGDIHEGLKYYTVSFYAEKNPKVKFVTGIAKGYLKHQGSIKYNLFYKRNGDAWEFSKLDNVN